MMYVMLTFGKTQKYYFLNRLKYIEGSLVNFLVRFPENNKNYWFEKKYIKGKMAEKDAKATICFKNIS